MKSKPQALLVISLLKKRYGRTFHKKEDPFFVLIFTILSARNRDSQTYKAASALFNKFPTMKSLAAANVSDIEDSIKFIGLFRQKARRVKETSRKLLKIHGGKVPETMDELLELPGVGRKTASCVLIYAYHKPAIAVDTHVHRISNRIGLVETKTPEQTERALMQLLPRETWLDVNELLVKHGQQVCLPIKPRCPECPVKGYCDYYKNEAKRKA
ncbi:MAG TPA: endonuclease III [Candidatus Nanoarchaeia archaeon]|nr:endonuclease III [Candidatus Nanoarchaeia archaeon]